MNKDVLCMYLSRKNSWQDIINALKHRTPQVTLLVKYYVVIKNYVHTGQWDLCLEELEGCWKQQLCS